MPARHLLRRATVLGTARADQAPIYVDSDDNKLKYIPAGSGTTEVEVNDSNGKAKQYGTITTYTGATDAIDISLGDIFMISRAGAVDAATLAAPATSDNGRIIKIFSGTAFAHTITITAGIGGAGATDDVITFTNRISASITLLAHAGAWFVIGSNLAAIA